jgi:hypothetical protein
MTSETGADGDLGWPEKNAFGRAPSKERCDQVLQSGQGMDIGKPKLSAGMPANVGR